MSPSPADPIPVQVRPACMGSEQGDPPPRGRAVAAEPRGETAVLPSRTRKFAATPARPRNRDTARNRSPPPSAQKRRSSNSPADVSVPKRAFRRDSGAAADASQSPERRALHTDHADTSQNSSSGIRLDQLIDFNAEALTPPAILHDELTDHGADPSTPTIPTDEPTFAHLLLTGRSEEEVADTAAKVNTWRNIPKRARPKIADMIVEIEARATSGDPCSSPNCPGCHACDRRCRAWQDFDYLFQILMRNKESEGPSVAKSGPKVDEIIRDRIQQVREHGWKGPVEEYLADAALRRKADLDRGQRAPVARVLGQPASPQDADAFCRNALTMQSGAAAHSLIGGVILPDTARLREKLAEKILPIDGQSAKVDALLQLRAERLADMQSRVTPDMIHELDEMLTKRARQLKPFKKKGRTGWRNKFLRDLHATRAGPSLNRMAIHFLLGKAPIRVYRRYGIVPLSPRDKMNGKGEEDPRPVGAPEPFYRWCFGSGAKVFEEPVKAKLPNQYAIGVRNGAQRMGKCTAFDAAQLPNLVWLGPDVENAYPSLKRMETVQDMCRVHPLAGTMSLSIYTLPTIYVHDIPGAQPRRYPSIDGVIQGCGIATDAYCISQQKPINWTTKTAEAAARGHAELPHFDEDPPPHVRVFLAGWLEKKPHWRANPRKFRRRQPPFR